jgi:hypothetical protein
MKDEEKAKEILECEKCAFRNRKDTDLGCHTCFDKKAVMEMAKFKNEKLDKMRRLADEMYFRMQTLSTDLRPLRKAMEDYHNFIIHEYDE